MDENSSKTSAIPAGWYENPSGAEKYRWWDGSRWTNDVANDAGAINQVAPTVAEGKPSLPVSPNTASDPTPSEIDNLPALKGWKTSIGFSILGFVASIVFWIVLVILFGICIESYVGGPLVASSLGSLAGAPAGLLTYTLSIIYVFVFYLSYFKERPRLRSSKAISFLNFFFGNVIFGALWNSNLTRSHVAEKRIKGVSYIYAVILSALAICSVGLMLVTVDVPKINQAKSYYQQLYAQYDGDYIEDDYGISFSIPNGWEEIALKEDSAYIFAATPLIDGGRSNSYIDLLVVEGFNKNHYDSMTADAIKTIHAPSITNWQDESFSKAEANGYTYWVFSGYGSQSVSGAAVNVYYECCQTFQNGNLYVFELHDYEKSPYDYPVLLNSFENFVSSAEYK